MNQNKLKISQDLPQMILQYSLVETLYNSYKVLDVIVKVRNIQKFIYIFVWILNNWHFACSLPDVTYS